MSAILFVYLSYITAIYAVTVIQPAPPVAPITPVLPMPPYPIWTQPPINPVIDVGISLLSQSVQITIEDRYAFINYAFYFMNNNNDASSPASSQLNYEISLQPNTFISYFSADLNGILFTGQTKERIQAANEYSNAIESGLNAVLVSQDHDANVFNIKLNIEKGNYAKLNIVAETFMLRRFGYYELALLTTNIYSSSMIHSEFTSTEITIDLYDESQITFTDVITPTNANHNINPIAPNQYKIDIILQKSLTMRQELILLRYKTQASTNINQLLYNAESQTFLHVFSYEHQSVTILPRRVVFVLDRSGSMGINKWQSAVLATIGAIQHLKPGIDKMNIILFDHTIELYSKTIISVTQDIINDAIRWLNGYNSRGSTNIYQSVIDAIDLIKYDTFLYNSEFEYVNQIILITDGKPTAGVTNSIQIQNGLYDFNNQQLQSAPASIFCIGIGDDNGDQWVINLNYPLLRSIARQNEGFDVMIRASQTQTILSQYYNILESPVLTYIEMKYNTFTSDVIANNINQNDIHNLTQTKYRGLYAGTDMVIAGKLNYKNVQTGLTVSLFARSIGGNPVSNTYPIGFPSISNNIIIDKIWAYLKLKQYQSLLDNPRLITMNTNLYNLLTNNALNLALKYNLVTPWTSMIVVDENNNAKQITDVQNGAAETERMYSQPMPNLPAPPVVMYTPQYNIPGNVGAPMVPAMPTTIPKSINSDCNIFNNDYSNCMKQMLSNNNRKCEYNQANGDCSLIVKVNAAASNFVQGKMMENELIVGHEDGNKVINEDNNDEKKDKTIFYFYVLSFCVLICALSSMIVIGWCYYCKNKQNKQMEMVMEINNV